MKHVYLYEVPVKSLGADCIEKTIRDEHLKILQGFAQPKQIVKPTRKEFRRYGSARKLYNFNIDNVSSY